MNKRDDSELVVDSEQQMRSAMRGCVLILCGRLREQAFIGQPRSWVKGDPLDPRSAVVITVRRLYELADRALEPEIIPEAGEDIHVPRVPIHVAEARAMMAMLMLADGRMYAGYTDDELTVLPGGAQIRMTFDPRTRQTMVEVRTEADHEL
jgi:hypothetical protein